MTVETLTAPRPPPPPAFSFTKASSHGEGDGSHIFGGTSPQARMVVAVAASLLWMTISSWLILVNKALLSGGFPYPMALSSLGMLFSGVCSYLACRVRWVAVRRGGVDHGCRLLCVRIQYSACQPQSPWRGVPYGLIAKMVRAPTAARGGTTKS